MTAKSSRELYIDLIKNVIIGAIYQDAPVFPLKIAGQPVLKYLPKAREWGRDLPSQAHSMIGLRRMNNIQSCFEQILADNVPGDLIETGVWRGGATIFMRALLVAYQISDRLVWVADSFEGLPVPDLERFPADAGWERQASFLAVPLEVVRANFARYGLLDDQVAFLKGWFADTLPTAPITQLALLRMDGDLYGSTWDTLSALYDKVAPGGFVIIDDYNFDTCRHAVEEYRSQHAIDEPMIDIDGYGVDRRRDF